MVISSSNPVFSVIWLVLSFVGGAFLLWLFGCDFLALLMIIVYVGAIAVLFLFVIMMLPTSLKPEKTTTANRIPFIFFTFSLIMVGQRSFKVKDLNEGGSPWELSPLNCIDSISLWLYGDGALWILLAGIILLIALIGALVLCLMPHSSSLISSKKQEVFYQISR